MPGASGGPRARPRRGSPRRGAATPTDLFDRTTLFRRGGKMGGNGVTRAHRHAIAFNTIVVRGGHRRKARWKSARKAGDIAERPRRRMTGVRMYGSDLYPGKNSRIERDGPKFVSRHLISQPERWRLVRQYFATFCSLIPPLPT